MLELNRYFFNTLEEAAEFIPNESYDDAVIYTLEDIYGHTHYVLVTLSNL